MATNILTNLPRTGDPGGASAAQIQLQTVIDDVSTVVMIVYGEGPDVERVLEVVVGRATASAPDAPIRRVVVWCPDPTVLSADQKKNYFRKDMVAIAIGLADQISDALDIDDAQSGLSVELAFAKAEAQSLGAKVK